MRRIAGAALALGAGLLLAGPAAAQLLGLPLPGLPGVGAPLRPGLGDTDLPRPAERALRRGGVDPAAGLLATARDLADAPLSELRRLTVERLLRDHRDLVEADDRGEPVVRGEVLALSPSQASLNRARVAGFRVLRESELTGLGLKTVALRPPRGMSAREAVRRLGEIDPEGAYEFNHLYQASGAAGPGRYGRAAGGAAARGRIGLVDGSVAAGHPALRAAKVTQRAFAPGGARVTDHATAVASLMVGRAEPFRGAAPGAELFVADVYGPTAAGGSADAIARGLSWLAENRVPVVNISLVGPDNRLTAAAVRALMAKGHVVVAAVGNDGPAAPPLYPAAYPGVVAVTGVDGRQRALPEAGRGPHVAFAAPGSDMAAAGTRGYLAVRGTSFAAPLVAGEILRRGGGREAVDALAREAADLGAPGPDPVYGRGLVADELRTAPARVGARTVGALRK